MKKLFLLMVGVAVLSSCSDGSRTEKKSQADVSKVDNGMTRTVEGFQNDVHRADAIADKANEANKQQVDQLKELANQEK